MKKWLLLLPVFVVIPILLFKSEYICACAPDGYNLAVALGEYPMRAGPEKSRDAFVSKVPVGSPDTKVRELFASVNLPLEKHCAPSQAFAGYHCLFEEIEEFSFFGKRRVGFQFDIVFDDQRRFKDVRFAEYRKDR